MRSRRITRTRYYCDFCEASGRLRGFWTRPAIEKHERGCTANPNRVCGLCATVGESLNGGKSEQRPIADLVACLSPDKDDFGMKELRELCGNCPACILAAIRQSGLQRIDFNAEPTEPIVSFEFNFAQELAEFWQAQNELRQEALPRRAGNE